MIQTHPRHRNFLNPLCGCPARPLGSPLAGKAGIDEAESRPLGSPLAGQGAIKTSRAADRARTSRRAASPRDHLEVPLRERRGSTHGSRPAQTMTLHTRPQPASHHPSRTSPPRRAGGKTNKAPRPQRLTLGLQRFESLGENSVHFHIVRKIRIRPREPRALADQFNGIVRD